MEKNEIMVGDWVKYEGEVMQVENWKGPFMDLHRPGHGAHVLPAVLEPIPLTKDIVENNGLQDIKIGSYGQLYFGVFEYHYEQVPGIYRIGIDGKTYPVLLMKYVHEVQHMLRLFGLNKPITLPIRHTGWVNVSSDGEQRISGRIYGTEEEARADVDSDHIATVKIEWEE